MIKPTGQALCVINKTTLTREELYEYVWSTPTVHLAKRFGISDVALGKICKKLHVPKPSLGYWARVAAGEKLTRKGLSAKPEHAPNSVTITPTETPLIYRPDAQKLIESLLDPANRIEVPKVLADPHKLVARTQKELLKCKPDHIYGKLSSCTDSCLSIRVSKQSLDRALRIMDAVLKKIEELGYSVEVENVRRHSETNIDVDGSIVPIILYEKTIRSLRDQNKDRSGGSNLYGFDKYIHTGTGCLIFVAGDQWGPTHSSRDGKIKLEEKVAEMVSNIIRMGELVHNKAVEWEETQRRWAEERRLSEIAEKRKAELEALRLQEEKRRRNLETQAENWTKSQQLRDFVNACEAQIVKESGSVDEGSAAARWLAWARQHADRIDPLENNYLSEAVRSLPPLPGDTSKKIS